MDNAEAQQANHDEMCDSPDKPNISREKFVQILERMRDEDNLARKINALLGEQDSVLRDASDFFDASCFVASGRQTIIDLLALLMRDDSSWVEYFVCELGYGIGYEPGCVTDAEGADIDLSDAGKLYDFLASEYAN